MSEQRDPFDGLDPIAKAVLYEGYALYPYRATSLKNSSRCSMGELGPGARRASEAPVVARQTASWVVRVGLLQPVSRVVENAAGAPVLELDLGMRRVVTWDEARERTLFFGPVSADALASAPLLLSFELAAFSEEEPLDDEAGHRVGTLRRSSANLRGELRLSLRSVGSGHGPRIMSVELTNRSAEVGARLAMMHSAHVAVAFDSSSPAGDAFVSITDGPVEHKHVVDACEYDGAWPVLVGGARDARCALFSPIILYDYPCIAPESPGDMFDATENDELLLLSILSLTEEERSAMRATDPRTESMLLRAESMGERLGTLHGAIREKRATQARRAIHRVGDAVILAPRGRDPFDHALAGKRALVVGIETEVEGRSHLVVVVDDDPGRDLGIEGHGLGHRFFVDADEVVPAGARAG